jgi:17beta-estradiol 17-dehydrogenase / very-long-chain 3-oxoacyl-CoA reductase
MYCFIEILAFIVGFTYLIKAAYFLLCIIYCHFVQQNVADSLQKYGQGSWALITGASDGIGKQMAIDIAKSGINVILVARNPQKLEATARDIKRYAPMIQTRTVVFDFSKT